MSLKKYTYSDWLNVKVVLNSTIGITNEVSEENKVTWDNFDEEERIQIQNKQKIVFENLLQKEFNKMKDEFQSSIENSKMPNHFIKNEFKSLLALFNGKFICQNKICFSPFDYDTKTFDNSYYIDMMIHKNNSILKGIVPDFHEVPSPNSRVFENEFVLPAVKISAVHKMLNLISKKRKNSNKSIGLDDKSASKEIIALSNDNIIVKIVNPYPDIFATVEAYDFFCQLEKFSVIEIEYVAGYAFIYHQMKNDKLGYPIKKNVRPAEFCDFLKDQREQPEIFPPKLKNRDSKRRQIIFEECKKNYLLAVDLAKNSPK